jgi:glycosyltransferase involved in cell wall biosynthesis
MKNNSVLYLSYTGLMEPLGQSQVLNYLIPLSSDFKIHIITFEKPEDLRNKNKVKKTKGKIKNKNIEWHPLKYHKKPKVISSFYDIFKAFILSVILIFKNKIEIVHARSYVVGTIALVLKKIFNIKFVFDMRGFWIDERKDGGIWKENSILYRLGKKLEKNLFNNADTIISLTKAGVREIEKWPQIKDDLNYKVIPTCTDLENFNIMNKNKNLINKHELNDKFIISYVGSVGSWYLFDEVLEFFISAKEIKENTHLLILNKGQHDFIKKKIREHKIDKKDITVLESDFEKVPEYINLSDIGLFFIKQSFSKKGSSPTKMGEFLACGVPIISNSGVGDIKEIIEENSVGEIVNNFNDSEYKKAFNKCLHKTKNNDIEIKCRTAAEEIYSLDQGVANYKEVYNVLQ